MYTLMSGCGQNHECGKHGCVQFCVKFEPENRWEPYLGYKLKKLTSIMILWVNLANFSKLEIAKF